MLGILLIYLFMRDIGLWFSFLVMPLTSKNVMLASWYESVDGSSFAIIWKLTCKIDITSYSNIWREYPWNYLGLCFLYGKAVNYEFSFFNNYLDIVSSCDNFGNLSFREIFLFHLSCHIFGIIILCYFFIFLMPAGFVVILPLSFLILTIYVFCQFAHDSRKRFSNFTDFFQWTKVFSFIFLYFLFYAFYSDFSLCLLCI